MSILKAFKCPDDRSYNRRHYSDEFHMAEIERRHYRFLAFVLALITDMLLGAALLPQTPWLRKYGETCWFEGFVSIVVLGIFVESTHWLQGFRMRLRTYIIFHEEGGFNFSCLHHHLLTYHICH